MGCRQLERLADDAVRMLLDREHTAFEILRRQYERAERELSVTGAGFFVDFVVPEEVEHVSVAEDFHFGDIEANLEGATYEESMPDEVKAYELSYLGSEGKRVAAELLPC